MGDNRTDFDHAIPMNEEAATMQEADLATVDNGTGGASAKLVEAKQVAKETAGKYTAQAADKARMFAEDGKTRATGALDQLSQMLTDAASQVDEKLGAQYGGYARQAAGTVQGLSEQVRNKDVDQLVGDVRAFVKRSPGIAIGAAAAIGFVVARVVQAGFDDAQRLGTPDNTPRGGNAGNMGGTTAGGGMGGGTTGMGDAA